MEGPDCTGLLRAWSGGDRQALDRLVAAVHGELRQIAKRYTRRERAGQTLQTTDLVNEAYLRPIDVKDVQWQHRAHFFAISAQIMRRILVDRARARGFQKRGGGAQHVTFEESMMLMPERPAELLELDEALTGPAAFDPRKAQIVELRYFGGVEIPETAVVLNVSERTILRDWKLAKAWLAQKLAHERKAAAALILSVAGVAAVAWEMHIANRERARAQNRFDELRSLARSLIFELHDDIATLPGSTLCAGNW